MSDSHAAHQRARKRFSTRAIVWWIVVALLVILVGCAAWIGLRGLQAKRDLEASVSLVSTIKTRIGAGDVAGARAASAELGKKTRSARDLTSDPVWRAGEILPLVGPNLTAVRELSAVVDDVAHTSIAPLAALAGTVNLASFKPVNGAIPLQPLVAAAPAVARANRTLQGGLKTAQDIDSSGTFSPVASAVAQLTSALRSASQITDTADRAAALLPAMLGKDGPRNYLLLFQNNAEARSTGGISGALALLHVENGAISMVQQASSQDFPHYPAPIMPLPPETGALYGDIAGEYIQDVNLTPQFPLAATLARRMWMQRYGTEVDGVLTMDPIALAGLLRATGPVTLATGDRLTGDNAAKLLLSDVYARYADPRKQDAFFASAAAEVFARLSSGAYEPKRMIDALAGAANDHRILVWSANAAEQTSLAQTTLAGELPSSSTSVRTFGVYLNDGTGSKMDYYLHASVGLGQATCRADKRPTYSVRVTVQSDAPADAATTLPRYVTGGGAFGTPPGSMRTNVAVYAPAGMTYAGTLLNGKPARFVAASNAGRQLLHLPTQLMPGESITLDVQFVGAGPFSGGLDARVTPGVHPTEVRRVDFSCASHLQ